MSDFFPGVFFACWTPYVAVQICSFYLGKNAIPVLVDFSATCLIFANFAINPIVFMALNRDFRRALTLIMARRMAALGYGKVAMKLRLGAHATSVLESMRHPSRISDPDSGVELETLRKDHNEGAQSSNRHPPLRAKFSNFLEVPGCESNNEIIIEEEMSFTVDLEEVKADLTDLTLNVDENETDSSVPRIILPEHDVNL